MVMIREVAVAVGLRVGVFVAFCQLNHPMAARGSISWPLSGVEERLERFTLAHCTPIWNHLVAKTTESGSMCWPEIRTKIIRA